MDLLKEVKNVFKKAPESCSSLNTLKCLIQNNLSELSHPNMITA
jgi:hypothetical protein